MSKFAFKIDSMKKRVIYTIDWVKRHPYKTAGEEDRYFADLAESVFNVIYKSEISDTFDDDKEAIADVAIRLTMWFEDLVSETGIWRAATTEFKKRYGSYIPFYELDNDYEQGFVNLEDVRFLIWNEAQSYVGNDRFLNPENPAIEWVSGDVFTLFDEAWETAPANERFYLSLHNETVLESYWNARALIEWFSKFAYVNPSAVFDVMDALDKSTKDDDDEEQMGMRLYSIAVQDAFCSKHNMLSITAPQWLGRIRDQKEREIWEDFRWRHISIMRFEEENDMQILFRDLVYDENLAVEKESFNETFLRRDLKQGDLLYCSLVSFRDAWYQCGQLAHLQPDGKLQKLIEDQRRKLHNIDYQATMYPLFKEVSGGKDVLFFGSLDEIKDAYRRMGFQGVDEHIAVAFDHNCLMMCSPVNGITLVRDMAACIYTDDNPFYDQEFAAKNAHEFYFNPQVLDYRETCFLHDNNMLPDARISSLKGEEYGRWFLRKHGSYIIDYYYLCTREYDYDAKFDLIRFNSVEP